MAGLVKIKTLRHGVTTPREGSRELDVHDAGTVILVPGAAADRLCRIGAAERVNSAKSSTG